MRSHMSYVSFRLVLDSVCASIRCLVSEPLTFDSADADAYGTALSLVPSPSQSHGQYIGLFELWRRFFSLTVSFFVCGVVCLASIESSRDVELAVELLSLPL
jgi:hypothetical protein